MKFRFARTAKFVCASFLLIGFLVSSTGAQDLPAKVAEEIALPAKMQALLAAQSSSIKLGIWVGRADGNSLVQWHDAEPRPVASAVKIAMLIELFDKYADRLDETRSELLSFMLADHPAVVHFSESQREEIRAQIAGASIRRIGRVMMGSEAASNIVYNAAANMTIALLGGPDHLTQLMHQRAPELQEIYVCRYMLAPRNQPRDNTATPRSLATIWRWLANESIPGVNQATFMSIEKAIRHTELRFALEGRHLYKDGALDSLPLTRVHAGSWTVRNERFAYVVMLEQSDTGASNPNTVTKYFADLATSLSEIAIASAIDGQR